METQLTEEDTVHYAHSLFIQIIYRGLKPRTKSQKNQMYRAKYLYSLDRTEDDWRTKAYRAIFHACPD